MQNEYGYWGLQEGGSSLGNFSGRKCCNFKDKWKRLNTDKDLQGLCGFGLWGLKKTIEEVYLAQTVRRH